MTRLIFLHCAKLFVTMNLSYLKEFFYATIKNTTFDSNRDLYSVIFYFDGTLLTDFALYDSWFS